mmetsp:Transcript_24246/g.38835  ORF Transcript_24246/g.38835 Transcript_24246/m.38835 type:complete len:913 (+) Transcript_24246:188-2926(+)
MRNVCGLVVNGVRVHGSGLNRCRGGVRLLRRVDLIIIKELIRLGIVSVDSAELEATANRFLNLHNEEVHKHEKNGESPADAVLRLHTEDNVVEARNVGEANLENNNNSDRVPGILVATEDTRVEGGVVSEASGKHNRNSTESEGIGSLGAKLSNRLLKAVSSLVKDGFGTSFSKLTVVNEVVASTATHDKDRTNGSGDECDSANDNSEEEEATDETLANTTGREAHDAILRHFNSKNETEGDSTDQVTVENLDRGERTELKTTDNTKEDSHTLGVVDGGVKEKDLTEVIPHGTTLLDGTHNSSKVIISKNHLSSLTSDISTLLTHSNTHVGGLESRGIVHTITSHTNNVVATEGATLRGTENLDSAVLILRENLTKSVSFLDNINNGDTLNELLAKNLGVVEVKTHTKTAGSLLSDSDLITSNHLDSNTKTLSLINGLLGIVTGRVKEGDKTHELPLAILAVLLSDTNGTKTTEGKVLNLLLLGTADLVSVPCKVNHNLGSTLGHNVDVAVSLVLKGSLGTLANRVEGEEVRHLKVIEVKALGDSSLSNALVDSIRVTLTLGSKGGSTDNLGGGELTASGGGIDGKLVEGESTGLIRAENIHTSHLLDSGDTGDDGILLGELVHTESHGDGKHSGHGNGDTTNEQDEHDVDDTTVVPGVSRWGDNDNDDNPESNVGHTEETDGGENLLQVAVFLSLRDKVGGLTEEGVETGGVDHAVNLTTLDDGRRVDLITRLLSHREGLTSETSLVNLEGLTLEDLHISGDNVTKLNGHDITRDELLGGNGHPLAVTLSLTFGGELVHESGNSITGLGLLVVTNAGVSDEKQNDTNEIRVIRGRAGALLVRGTRVVRGPLVVGEEVRLGTVGEHDGDNSGSLHDPGKRVPHKSKKLHKLALDLLGKGVGTVLLETGSSLT